jgi:hypothetical protein
MRLLCPRHRIFQPVISPEEFIAHRETRRAEDAAFDGFVSRGNKVIEPTARNSVYR